MPGRRLSLTDTEAHDLVLLLMAGIQKVSASGTDPERLRRLRAMLDRLTAMLPSPARPGGSMDGMTPFVAAGQRCESEYQGHRCDLDPDHVGRGEKHRAGDGGQVNGATWWRRFIDYDA